MKSPMPMGDNGTNSAERLMPEALSNAAARFVDSLKINSISEAVRRGRRVVIKRRHAYSEQLTELANLYFRIASLPIRFWTKTEDWQRWEVDCFNDAQRRSVSRLAPAQQRDLHRPVTGREPLGTFELPHTQPANGGSSRIRIPASAPVPEQRIPGTVVSRRCRHGQCDL